MCALFLCIVFNGGNFIFSGMWAFFSKMKAFLYFTVT